MKYGFNDKQWQDAKAEMKRLLGKSAKARSTIAYSELAARMQTISLPPESYALGVMLGEISQEEDAAGRGMLSVLVCHKDGDQMPGRGFLDWAHQLGRSYTDKQTFWINELNRVYAAWS